MPAMSMLKEYAPAATNDSAISAVVPTNAPQLAVPQRPLRILLAEDAPDNRTLIEAYFKRLPYQVEMAENGMVAVEKFRAGRYDLVLMDIQMPLMDGYEATRLIREFETRNHLPPTPILALTTSILEEDVQRAFEAGCNAHVVKPVRKAALLEAMSATLTAEPPLASGAPSAPALPPLRTHASGTSN
jgi:CheY-like chemotaxis protein